MSAEEEKDDVAGDDASDAKKPARKKAAKKATAKAADKAADAKADAGKADAGKAAEPKAAETKKPAAKKAAAKKAPAKKAADAEKAPVAEEKKASRAKVPAKPRRRVVRAHARYVRTSARKARMVCVHIRGKSISEARAILAFTSRDVAGDWSKLLESAVANAENNHELLEDDLIVREAYADEGPTIKRFRPRAMGRATPIRKRTSHLTIALTTDTTQRATKRKG
jgi:ribosomal protein L22